MTDPQTTIPRERYQQLRREATEACEAYRKATMNVFDHWVAWQRAEDAVLAARLEGVARA